MSLPRSDPVRLVSAFLCFGALLSIVTLTLIDRGATRAYSTPWIYLFWSAHAAPLLALGVRVFAREPTFVLPNRPWCILAGLFTITVVVSAVLSPFRGPTVLASLTSLSAIAAFFLIHDASQRSDGRSHERILRVIGLISLAIVVISLGRWTLSLISSGAYKTAGTFLGHRNDYPLGHTNYTAGLALLVIPWFAQLAWQARGLSRFGWVSATALGFVMLFTSGSRGGLIGLAAMLLFAILSARLHWRTLVLLLLLGATLTVALTYAHPRTRAMIFGQNGGVAVANLSDIQRTAMAEAGLSMGLDRPVLGWGIGTTPLVYPRYRSKLDGGVENAFQLHSTPVQFWADLGSAGAACLITFAVLMWRDRRKSRRATLRWPASSVTGSTRKLQPTRSNATFAPISPAISQPNPEGLASDDLAKSHEAVAGRSIFAQQSTAGTTNAFAPAPSALFNTAFVAFAGYAAFALTDYQFDVPIFAVAMATCGALVAQTRTASPSIRAQRWLALAALGAIAFVALLGHRAPYTELNVRGLALGNDPATQDEAIRLLNESLALNPDQEIAHFNLGWLLVVRDPAAAEEHFLAAAQLVPDKGGVYFGLALARLNQDRPNANSTVVRALAMESLNDPKFLISPWWNQPSIGAHRAATVAELHRLAERAATILGGRNDRRSRDARYLAALADWLDDQSPPGEMLRHSHTSQRVSYFAARPLTPDWKKALTKAYRRERTAYPILMRDLDLPVPLDLFDVQENSLASGELELLFPEKGWLPAPLLLELLLGDRAKIDLS